MASTFLTVPTPFLHKSTAASFSNSKLPLLKRNSLKINATSKQWEPTKVVPQADRVLIRLEELSQTTTGGILLPRSAVKFERYLTGEVLSVGAEAENVKAGAKILGFPYLFPICADLRLCLVIMFVRWIWGLKQSTASVNQVTYWPWSSRVCHANETEE
ncbi:hypothetical protein KIW84_046253 [Lathyrus oleraceus]|uniref:Uncharacterized protein n=1 Tax=Pisum sativum TaxID=3888 RepID=A0A9D5AYE9_PEA|nr:hypothetical protein KIW84_046253 [Pisum sativum]